MGFGDLSASRFAGVLPLPTLALRSLLVLRPPWQSRSVQVAIVGGFGDAEAAEILKQIYSALKIVNLDVQFSKPGCGGTSSKFVSMFWANLRLAWDYAWPCFIGLPACATLARIGEFWAVGLAYPSAGARFKKLRKNFKMDLTSPDQLRNTKYAQS